MSQKKTTGPLGGNDIVRLMQSDDSVNAPADAIKWTKNLSRAFEPKPSLIRRLVAVLTADLSPKALAGERSGSTAAARQMLFMAGETAIDLRLKPDGSRWSIAGQVLGGPAGARLTLEGSGSAFETILDDVGRFRFDEIPEGVFSLRVTADGLEIVVPDVTLK